MPRPMPIVAEGQCWTDCPGAPAHAVAALTAALRPDVALPSPAAEDLLLVDLDHAFAPVPRRAQELDPATLKWGGSTGRKDG